MSIVNLVALFVVTDFAIVVVAPKAGRSVCSRVAVFIEIGVSDSLHQAIVGACNLMFNEQACFIVGIFVSSAAFNILDKLVLGIVFVSFFAGKLVTHLTVVIEAILI